MFSRAVLLVTVVAAVTPGALGFVRTPAVAQQLDRGMGPDAAAHDESEPVLPMRRGDLPLDGAFTEELAPFRVRIAGRNRLIGYRVSFTGVLPGEVLELTVEGGRDAYTLRPGDGRVVGASAAGWRWEAPTEPGTYAFRVEGRQAGAVHVNVFVMVPRSAMTGESLNGYRIGEYRVTPARRRPRGFIVAAARDEDVLLSPHFTLGQFLCKQPGSPRYAIVSVPLVQKLESILARVVQAGHDVRTLHVMSAYRTPWYNRQIGNTTTLSHHLYGEAADVFVDADADGYMDDLNGDGRRDVGDAQALFRMVEQVEQATRPAHVRILVGGLKAYRRNQVRGPFVHVDVRGRAARW